MSGPYRTCRPIVMSRRGLVSAGHYLSAMAGVRSLADGGNAMDAAVTAAAVEAVTKPNMCGLGGDLFLLVYDARRGQVFALNSSGPAPRLATLDRFPEGIPGRGLAAASVPGCVGGWAAALERFGSIGLAEALAPAVAYAAEGFPVSDFLSQSMASSLGLLQRFPATAAVFLKAGRPYRPGELLIQPDLAESLRAIAAGGAGAFYRGKIAEAIGRFSEQGGGLLRADDFATFIWSSTRPIWSPPITTTYRGFEVCGQPPVSYGFAFLEELNLVEPEGVAALGHNSADHIHLFVEAKKLAFADRERYLTDPEFVPVPIDGLLSKDYAARRRQAIDRRRANPAASPGAVAGAGRDTTYLCAVDRDGNAVSLIQSIFHDFGCGETVPGTGIVLNNRMTGFSVDPAHVNCVAPGKRTAHTLNAAMLLRNGRPYLVFGTPGGPGQVQTNLQFVSNVVDFGLSVQQAIEAPRWRSDEGPRLTVETRFPSEALADLATRGHELVPVGDWSPELGSLQAILLDPATGSYLGGADPRREGYAIGL